MTLNILNFGTRILTSGTNAIAAIHSNANSGCIQGYVERVEIDNRDAASAVGSLFLTESGPNITIYSTNITGNQLYNAYPRVITVSIANLAISGAGGAESQRQLVNGPLILGGSAIITTGSVMDVRVHWSSV